MMRILSVGSRTQEAVLTEAALNTGTGTQIQVLGLQDLVFHSPVC